MATKEKVLTTPNVLTAGVRTSARHTKNDQTLGWNTNKNYVMFSEKFSILLCDVCTSQECSMESLAASEMIDRRRQQCQLSRRTNTRLRNTNRSVCTSVGRLFPGLLALILSSKTLSTASAFSVVSGFVPLRSGISHIKISKAFGFLEEIFPQHRRRATILRSSNSGDQSRVEVWDGVFSPEVCESLHELAIDHSERTTGEEEEEYDEDEDDDEDDSLDGSSIFYHRGRNRSENDQLTPIEQALDSFLTAYYDRATTGGDDPNREVVVEYWCRQEHLNLEAHADVDEVLFERSCKKVAESTLPMFRYPTMGHVLYLTKPTLGLGPTCVFPPKETFDKDGDTYSSIKDEIESMVTVPAVPGRVLRFPGSALHGVPKPADVWFFHDNDDDDGHSVDGYGVDAEWGDDDDEERSVILFNTWERKEDDVAIDLPVGPIGVPFDPMFHVNSDIGIVDMMMSSADMEGVEVDEDFVKGMAEYAKQQKNEQLEEWYEKYCDHNVEGDPNKPKIEEDHQYIVYSKVRCQPSELWKLAEINGSHGPSEVKSIDSKGVIRVPLMGDEMRRRYPQKQIRWTVPSWFEEGVKESEKPCKFPLR